MASKQWFLFLVVIASSFSSLALSIQVEDQGDVLTRLHTIEGSIMALHKDNEYLRLENKKLHMDNADLRTLLLQLRQDYGSQKEEMKEVKQELINMKLKLENAEEDQNSFHELNSGRVTNESKSTKYVEPDNKDKDPSMLIKQAQQRKDGTLHIRKSQGKTKQLKQKFAKAASTKNKKILERAITETEPKISFSAHMSGPMYNLTVDQPFVFDVTNNNEGAAYDYRTGVFVCPVSGTYFFTAHILSGYHDNIWAELVINNVVKSRMYAGGSKDGNYGSASNSLITHCTTNASVWVRHFGNHGTRVEGQLYSHFAGFILWTDSNHVSNIDNIIG